MHSRSDHFRRSNRLARCTAWLLLALPLTGATFELGNEDWQVHGFLSQGYTLTSNNDFFGSSQGNGSLDFTEIGVNLVARPWPNLLIAAQGLYRNAGGSDRNETRLDFAQLDYHWSFEDRTKIGVRLGRVKHPIGIYNETRDVVWARAGVLLPQAIYLESLGLREVGRSSDGGLIYGRHAVGDHALSAEFLVAEPQDGSQETVQFFTGTASARGDFGGSPLLVGRAGYEWREGRVKLLASFVSLDRDFDSSTPSVGNGNIKLFYPILSGQLNFEDWSFTGEYGRIDTERSDFLRGAPPSRNTAETFYLQAQYRFAPAWSALLRYESFVADVGDRDGSRTSAQTGLPRHRFFSNDIVAGLRWEFARDWLIAAEYHNIDGTALLSTVDNPELNLGGGDRHTNLFAVILSYRF